MEKAQSEEHQKVLGLGRKKNEMVVEKSQPLYSLWKSDLTLSEFKILDTYLARINSKDPDHRTVVFSKAELEKLMGVGKINNASLKERLKHLMGNVVEVADKDEQKGVRLITLFEEAQLEQKNITLTCTQSAMKYIFDIESIGYLRYKLHCVTTLKSRYAYILFICLEKYRNFGTWTVSLGELKKILSCDKDDYYNDYRRFNDRILKRVHKEIEERTYCRYTYEAVKKGRSVVSIRFTIEPLPKEAVENTEPEQITMEQYLEEQRKWQDAVADFDLNDAQLSELKAVLDLVPENLMPQCGEDADRVTREYHYLDGKVREVYRRDTREPIKHKYEYLLAMIKRDTVKHTKKMDKTNFDQRDYDFESLEQMLLGSRPSAGDEED